MNKYIAYFDYLGFKQFIEKNDLAYQKRIVGNNFRDIENALSQQVLKRTASGRIVPDITMVKINCINFSDTIVFWTNDDSEESLKEILEVVYIFNYQTVSFFFPARGALVFGEIEYVDFKQQNYFGGIYNINSVYGKGLVKAHEKAEMQQWAGTVIDNSVVKEIGKKYQVATYLEAYASLYKIPYKRNAASGEEYAFRLVKGNLNDEAFKNVSSQIKSNFADHKKSIDSDDVQLKIKNTIDFLATFRDINKERR